MNSKSIFLTLLMIFSFTSFFAQEIAWQKTIGGSDNDHLWCIRQTSDGGYICGGTSNSNISGDKTEDCWGYHDYWVVKVDSVGTILWQNTIGGNDHDWLYAIQQTDDGGYILGGQSISNISGDKTENNLGGFDYWIIKLDSAGNIEWQNTIGGNQQDYLTSIQQTSDGGFICGGYSTSPVSGDKTENSQGYEDFWIIKLDPSGLIQWQNTIGGQGMDFLNSISQTPDDGYICAGTSNSSISGDKTEDNIGQEDYWVVKLDWAGSIQYQNTIGGASKDDLKSIRPTTGGGYICGGFSSSNKYADKAENQTGGGDYWIINLDSSLNINWQNTICGNIADIFVSVIPTSNNCFMAIGYTVANNSYDKTENNIGGYDYWILQLDSTGNIIWQNSIGGNANDIITSIQQTPNGDLLLGGMSSSGISGDKTENSKGGRDFWIINLDNSHNLIQGVEYADFNSNNIKDLNEPPIGQKKILESTSGRFAITDQNGFYTLTVLDSGSFTIQPEPINLYNHLPATHNALFNGFLQTDSQNDFAFQPTGTFNDLCITITPATGFRSGFNATYVINYFNYGTTTIVPNIVFYPDDDLTFISANPVAASVTIDSVVWNPGSINPFQLGQIIVTVNVNSGLPIGTLINSGVFILPLAGDVNPGCNQDWWELLTTGSVDPNDILVNRDSLFDYELASPPWLEYIIRFQNTGNDTAFYVRVDNKISPDLQLSEFEMITASHPCSIEYQSYDSTMKFTFNNILLPDSNVNEPLSHGFVRYRIKPVSTLVTGDLIENNARIIFDYNAPVETNTATTEIVAPTSLTEFTSGNISLYPNPAFDNLNVVINDWKETHLTIELYNIYGQQVRTLYDGIINEKQQKHSFDISALRSGMYFVIIPGSAKPLRFVKY